MKKSFFIICLMLPLMLFAQTPAATALLEQAVKKIEADAAVQMTFAYTVYDNAGEEQFSDEGALKLAGGKYALHISPMRLWCDGETQWNYMASNNELYITQAGSDEAQIYNPVYLMGLYKEGYDCEVKSVGGKKQVTLSATSADASFDKVEITLDAESLRPTAMTIFVAGQGYTKILINGYKPKCMFDARVYKCPVEDFPGVEIVDMR